MSFKDQFTTALNKAKDSHPNISHALALSVMKKFIERWELDKKKPTFRREGFGQLIRLTLNEMQVSVKADRQMYSALIGHYFSAHGAYAKARQRKSGRVPQKPQPTKVPFGVTMSANGQLAWQI
jgi:hypothetical protein